MEETTKTTTEELWEEVGMYGWLKCKICNRHLTIKDARDTGTYS
jgi:hypothetical protein